MRTDFKPVMDALFAHICAAVTFNFAADMNEGSAVLSNVSAMSGLFVGLPVFGDGVQSGAVIQALDPLAATITLSLPLTATASAVSFTTGFLTTGRRVKHWNQVSDQPAFFLRRPGVLDEEDGLFIITTLECEAWIYCNAGEDPDTDPDDALTTLEQLIRDSFAPDDGDDVRFTLGGLVHWCRIVGRSDISSGDQGPQAIARIPIRITLP